MSLTRKQTAFRKSRKFGDVHGGRDTQKTPDKVFRRAHSLKRPGPHDELPIVIEDNASRNFFFPISGAEALEAVSALPKKVSHGLTHIWLKRATQRELNGGTLPLAEFICGSGVRVIVLYPWRKDLKICWGRKKPKGIFANAYERFGAQFWRQRGWWYAQFTESDLRRFYIEFLLYHEVGHHVDWYHRHWSKANSKQLEDAANEYAVAWSKTAKHVFNRLEKARDALS